MEDWVSIWHLILLEDEVRQPRQEWSWSILQLVKLLSDLFEGPIDPTVIHCDNISCIRLSEDPIFHGKTKHINKYHYIQKLVQDGVL